MKKKKIRKHKQISTDKEEISGEINYCFMPFLKIKKRKRDIHIFYILLKNTKRKSPVVCTASSPLPTSTAVLAEETVTFYDCIVLVIG